MWISQGKKTIKFENIDYMILFEKKKLKYNLVKLGKKQMI